MCLQLNISPAENVAKVKVDGTSGNGQIFTVTNPVGPTGDVDLPGLPTELSVMRITFIEAVDPSVDYKIKIAIYGCWPSARSSSS